MRHPRTYTPQEAAILAGVRLQRIQNPITERQLGRVFGKGRDGRRRLDLPAVLTFATAQRLGKVRAPPDLLNRAFKKAGVPGKPIQVTETVTIDATRLLASVVARIELRAGLDADPNAEPIYRRLCFNTVGLAPSQSIPGRMLPRMEMVL